MWTPAVGILVTRKDTSKRAWKSVKNNIILYNILQDYEISLHTSVGALRLGIPALKPACPAFPLVCMSRAVHLLSTDHELIPAGFKRPCSAGRVQSRWTEDFLLASDKAT
jgi:hypothetical protein